MKHIREFNEYEDDEYTEVKYTDVRYSYIRYKTDEMNAILRTDMFSENLRLLQLPDTFSDITLNVADLHSVEHRIKNREGCFWRDATDEEIEYFKLRDIENKYNL